MHRVRAYDVVGREKVTRVETFARRRERDSECVNVVLGHSSRVKGLIPDITARFHPTGKDL